MYFLFRGLRRESGESVIGRVFGLNEDTVRRELDVHGIVVDTFGPETDGGLFPAELDDALDEAGVRVTFNQMPRVHEGHGIWMIDPYKIRGRVMKLAQEALGRGKDRQAELRRMEHAVDAIYGHPGEIRFATADEVQAEMRRLMSAINKLERELIAIRSRPAAREPRRTATHEATRDRTQDEVLREIFEHNLELMKLTSEHGIIPPPSQ